MQFHTILTHEAPDMDAMLCCYLLYRYGEQRYSGIQHAKLQFCPAGSLPGDKSPQALEEEGVLVVDMGGGRLDTHPDGNFLEKEKQSLSASNLVATDLGIADRPSLQNLLEFVRLHDSMGKSLSSRNPVDHLVCLPNLVRGALTYFGRDFEAMVRFFIEVFDGIEAAHELVEKRASQQPTTHLITYQQDKFWMPPVANLKSLFAGYLASTILKKEVQWGDFVTTGEVTRWDNISNFLESWHLLGYPELQKLIAFVSLLKPDAYLLDSHAQTDQAVSLPNIVQGLAARYAHDLNQGKAKVFQLFDCAVAYERSWQDAIQEYQENRQLYQAGAVKIAAIAAKSGAVIKVARWQDKADVVIYQDLQESHVSISLNQLGRLKNHTLERLAARIRAAELVYAALNGNVTPPEDFFAIGEAAGWFLHQSGKLLLHGSPKGRRQPSRLPMKIIVPIVLSEFSQTNKLPDEFCPVDKCLHQQCMFYSLRLINCFHHRQNLRAPNSLQPLSGTVPPQ